MYFLKKFRSVNISIDSFFSPELQFGVVAAWQLLLMCGQLGFERLLFLKLPLYDL